MKYLLIFFFAGFLIADATDIVKYKLSLTPGNEGFQGKVTLTLSDTDNRNEVELDEYNAGNVTKCTYTGTETPTSTTPSTTTPSTTTPSTTPSTTTPPTTPLTTPSTTPSTTTPPTTPLTTPSTTPSTTPPTNISSTKTLSADADPPKLVEQICKFDGKKIKFESIRTGREVILEFEGEYSTNGLNKYETENKKERLFVADMTLTDHQIIFPCKQSKEAEFEFDGGYEVMSNLENLKGKDGSGKVSLRSIIFIQGDIVKDGTSIPSFPYYRMTNSKPMGPKLKKVMEKVSKLDASVRVLFTPLSKNLQFNSRDIIILRDVLNPDDSTSNYWEVAQTLGEALFKRPKKEENSFLDKIGPLFTHLKILGGDTTMDQIRIFARLDGLEKDGFNNSASLNDLASSSVNHMFEHPALVPKGLSVLYSLESICGDDKFTTGLSNYIKNANSLGEEAFQACFENIDKAKEFFKAWIHKPGYPVVHVTSNKTGEYHLSQERFLWYDNKQNDERWVLPIDYKTGKGECKSITLPATKDKVSQEINSTYFILDHKNKGFYRVNYDAKVWEALITQLKSNHTAIDPFSRMQLVDDVFSFPKSIYNLSESTPDYVTALKLSDYLRNETDIFALQPAFGAFHFLDSALNSSHHGKFRNHARSILNGIYKGVTKKPAEYGFLQEQVISLACKFGVEECIKNATNTFQNIKWDTRPSRKEEMAICSVVRNDSAKWMQSFASLTALNLPPSENIDFLTCSRDEKVLSLFISQFISQRDERNFKKAVTAAMDNNPDNIKVILSIVNRFKNATVKVFGKECLQDIVRHTLPTLNSESAVTLKDIAKGLDEKLEGEVNRACEYVKQWTNTKAKRVEDYFKGSGSQAKPIALVLLATTLIPLVNHIFHN